MRLTALLAALAIGVSACGGDSADFASDFRFLDPQDDQLLAAREVDFTLELPAGEIEEGSLAVRLDGEAVPREDFRVSDTEVEGTLSNVEPGRHDLTASARVRVGDSTRRFLDALASFETVALENPQNCEVLNQAECILPYPSSRFLEEVGDTPTGYQLTFTDAAMPVNQSKLQAGASVSEARLSPDPYKVLDGFSPTAQVLMHFPTANGVDLEASDAPIVTEARKRKTNLRSLQDDSPTVLIDAETGERILHWTELDARTDDPARELVFLRPGEALEPGHRYIVAVRDLVDADGNPVRAEPVFTAFRDNRPTDIQAVESRRDEMEAIFADLERAGVPRDDLILAFDFVVQSSEGLTGQMKTMRDEAFNWLDSQSQPTFTVTSETVRNDQQACADQSKTIWKVIQGTYEVPLYLSEDPETDPGKVGFLQVDDQGNPVRQGTTNPPYTITIPCAVFDNTDEVIRPLLLGHGLFQTGESFSLSSIGDQAVLRPLAFVTGATNWRGLSDPDLTAPSATESFLISGIFSAGSGPIGNFDDFAALPDRLRQGMLNTLILARMMKQGTFNSDPAFEDPDGNDIFPGESEQMYYFGVSLGGIMGSMFATLTPDVDKFNVDVPGSNFSLLLQRAMPFNAFEGFLNQVVEDSMVQAISLSIIHELWVRGESAGYLHDLEEEVSGSQPDKEILITPAWLDPQVTTQAAKIVARSLDVPNLAPGSFLMNIPQIPDRQEPLSSAFVMYDTGIYDRNDPDEEPFIPPLANLQADQENGCSPHPRRALIPASVEQLDNFFQPGGQIENFCEGMNNRCDADRPKEIVGGKDMPCDPVDFQ